MVQRTGRYNDARNCRCRTGVRHIENRQHARAIGAVYEALREAAFKERRKIHDLVLEGIQLALRKRKVPR